jgi:uncharacterized membrane protein YphA (DoxX/SURF4 family)
VSHAFWQPVWLVSVFGIGPPTVTTLQIVQAIWWSSLALAGIGLWTRWSTLVAFIAGSYLLAIPHSFGQTYHFDALVVFILLILAVAPCGDGWSIDALRRTARHDGPDTTRVSGDYRWPIVLVRVMMALVFVAAGLTKLRHSGFEWVTSDTLSIILTRGYYHVSDADPIGPFGLLAAKSPIVSRTLAVLTIVVEVGYPLALISRTARFVLVPAGIFFLLGIRV